MANPTIEAMREGYACRRVRTRCPRCGGENVVNRLGMMRCKEKTGKGFCNTVWHSTAIPVMIYFKKNRKGKWKRALRLEIGDDSRLYRNERKYIGPRPMGMVQLRIINSLYQFRQTGIVLDFPGMGE